MAAVALKVDEIELALSRVALGVYGQVYKGVKTPELEPQRKTLMHDAWHGKNLSARHQKAWRITVDLFRDACGISPAGSSFADKISGSGDARNGATLPTPRAGNNYQQDRIEWLMGYFLHKHQKVLLHRLLIEHFQNVKSGSLAELGKQMSGYADTAQSRAAGVTSMQRLLDSLAEFHGI